jgi:phosphoglycerate dehydrogenase-like enzyme
MKQTPKIIVTTHSFSKNQILRSELLEYFSNVEFNDNGFRYTGSELVDYLKSADGVIVGLDPMNSGVIEALPKLKIISKFGVGLDNVDVEYAKSKNISIGWTGGVNKRSVSEQTLCFMLGHCRNIFGSAYRLKQAVWEKNGGMQLSGKTIGIIGAGYIGTDVLRILQPFNCNLLICDIIDKTQTADEFEAKQVELNELLMNSDIITLHVPLTVLTKHMINSETIKQMKSTAFVINTSRGPVVDQAAIKNALKNNLIAGAALDVFEKEPPTDLEFLAMQNLITTPHIGGNAVEAVLAMGRSAINHLRNFFK